MSSDGKPCLDAAAPILDAEGRPTAVLVLRVDPQHYLYPLLESWPTPSRTAETLLVRNEGEEVVFLNQLRHSPSPPLTLHIPLSRAEVPAVRAALGEVGEFEGPDYRGVDVLADIRPVPDSPWYMVAKVDSERDPGRGPLSRVCDDALRDRGDCHDRRLVALTFHYRQRSLYQDLYLRGTSTAGGPRGDPHHPVQHWRRGHRHGRGGPRRADESRGRAAYRLAEAEAVGKPLEQVFRIVNEQTRAEVANPAVRVIQEGKVVGLANHTVLIARDGAERPIADSGRRSATKKVGSPASCSSSATRPPNARRSGRWRRKRSSFTPCWSTSATAWWRATTRAN